MYVIKDQILLTIILLVCNSDPFLFSFSLIVLLIYHISFLDKVQNYFFNFMFVCPSIFYKFLCFVLH